MSMKLKRTHSNYIFNRIRCRIPTPISTVHFKLQNSSVPKHDIIVAEPYWFDSKSRS